MAIRCSFCIGPQNHYPWHIGKTLYLQHPYSPSNRRTNLALNFIIVDRKIGPHDWPGRSGSHDYLDKGRMAAFTVNGSPARTTWERGEQLTCKREAVQANILCSWQYVNCASALCFLPSIQSYRGTKLPPVCNQSLSNNIYYVVRCYIYLFPIHKYTFSMLHRETLDWTSTLEITFCGQ